MSQGDLATPGQRLGASLLDALLLGVPVVVVSFVLLFERLGYIPFVGNVLAILIVPWA